MKLETILLPMILIAMSACSSKSSNDGIPPAAPNAPSRTRDIPEKIASGTLFGNPWEAMRAGANQTADGQVSISIYADERDVCDVMTMSDRPYATIVLPEISNGGEFVTDADNDRYEAPVVLIDPIAEPIMNLVSERSIVRVTATNAAGFDLAVLAHATEESGRLSEFAGTVNVVDCDKQVPFTMWRSLEGSYRVVSLDGQALPGSRQIVEFIEYTKSDYQDNEGRRLSMVSLPLIERITDGSSVSIDFGPIEGRGTSSRKDVGDKTLLTYDYNGPINYRGQTYSLDTHIEVLRDPSGHLEISYSFEIPGEVAKTSHRLELRK